MKERERQIVTSKTGEAHLNVEEASLRTKHCPTKQVICSDKLKTHCSHLLNIQVMTQVYAHY